MTPLRRTQSEGPYAGHGIIGQNRRDEPNKLITTGWAKTCTCPLADPIPCTVLDPFSGSGTTCKVAARLGRHAIGIDISDEYLDTVTDARMGDGFQMEMTP